MKFNSFLTIEKEIVPLKIVKNIRAKKITLSVIPQKYCRITLPPFILEEQWKEFINTNQKWVLEKFKATEKHLIPSPAFTNGEKIFFKGTFLTLKITNSVSECTLSNSDELLMPSQTDKIHLLNLFYLKQCIAELKKYHIQYNDLTRPVKKFRIRSLASRWGSCSSKLSISINYRLILAPEEIFEYVFIHELVHLNNMSHSQKFWIALENILPDYRKRKKWLKIHSSFLMNYPEPVNNNKYKAVLSYK